MTAGLEGIAASQWVTATLTTDPDLVALLGGPDFAVVRVVEGALPPEVPTTKADGSPWPWVTFTVVEPQDVKVVGLIQVMAMVDVLVRVSVVGETYAPALPVYARVHALLESQTNQVTDQGRVHDSGRMSAVQFPEQANGIQYRHLGGMYRTHITT